MRSLVVLILAAAGFAGFLLQGHFRAAALRSGEASAVDHMLRLVEKPGRSPAEAGGYSFRWEQGQNLPDLLVGAPIEHGEGGVRWFATPDGVAIYEFDTVLFMAKGGPEVTALRRYLALTGKQREGATLPQGWRLLD